MKRINMNMDDELALKVDEYAKRMGVNRSAAISMLCSQMLEQKDAMAVMYEFSKAVNLSSVLDEKIKDWERSTT